MANTGSINIVLTAQSSAFQAAIDKASHGLHSFAEKGEGVGESLKGTFEKLPSLLSGGGIETALSGASGGLSSLASTAASTLAKMGPVGIAIGVAAVAATAGIAAFIGLGLAIKSIVEPQMEAINATFHLASALKIPVDELQTLQAVAKIISGVMADDFNSAMLKFAKNLGQAQAEGGKTEKALERLGLTAKQLANGDLGQSFEQVADKIHAIESPTEQARLAVELFGREGAKLLPMFMQGSEGIRKAHEEALKFGYALTTMDAAKVSAAQEIFESIGQRIEGMKNTLTVTLAPAISAIGEGILEWMPTAKQVTDVVTSGLTWIVEGIGLVVDGYQLWQRANLSLTAYIADGANGIVQTFMKVATAILDTINLIPGVQVDMPEGLKTLGEKSAAFAKAAHDDAKKEWDKPLADGQKWINDAANASQKAGEKLAGEAKFKKAQDAAAEAGEKITETLQKAVDDLDLQKFAGGAEGLHLKMDLGLTDEDIKKVKELRDGGASEEQVKKFEDTAAAIDKLKEAAKGNQAIEEMQQKLAALQAAAARGIEPKLAEEMAKLHLGPDQAQKYLDLANGIKKIEDSTKVADKLKELRAQIDGLNSGLTQGQTDIKKMGGSDADVAAEGALEKQKKLHEEINKLVEDSKTAQDKYNDTVGELNDALKQGMITQEQYNKLLDKADKDKGKDDKKKDKDDKPDKDLKPEERRFAFTAINPEDKGQDRVVKVQEDQLKIAQQGLQWQRDTRDYLQTIATGSGDDDTIDF